VLVVILKNGVWKKLVTHLWVHLQPFRSQHLDERQGKYAFWKQDDPMAKKLLS
jgi:hypothetical protein